jgi:transcriptional repressor NrdR
LYVAKKNGILQEFSKEKLVSGVKKAIQGRPIDDDALATLAQKVEDAIRYKGVSQIDSYDIGLLLLDPLRDLDEVAYLRFASVYQCFDSLDDFEKEIQNLKNRRASVDAL